jgi:hypothetical protein
MMFLSSRVRPPSASVGDPEVLVRCYPEKVHGTFPGKLHTKVHFSGLSQA